MPTVRLNPVTENPSGVFLYWTEEAIKKFLRDSGFDLAKTISRYEDYKTGDLIFEQL